MNYSELIDRRIAKYPDWRGQTMAEIRGIVRETVPDVTEELKWRGAPTWSHNGILCICTVFKDFVKVTFLNGAHLKDVDGVFNAELGGSKWRAIKIFKSDKVNASGLKTLLLAAVEFNDARGKGKAKSHRDGGGATRKAKPRRSARSRSL